jgi:hypothetical protein
MTINIAALFSTKDMCPKEVRIEPVFDEIALIGQVEEEFEDVLASPLANPLLEKSRGYFEL